jgi:hypothetical protein
VIDRTAVLELDPELAEIVTLVFVLTLVVSILKVPLVLPAKIVTEAGTVADDWLLESEMIRPPTGAPVLIVTTPLLVFPPNTTSGLSLRETRLGGEIARVAVPLEPFKAAEIVAVTFETTETVFTATLPVLFPLAIVSDMGMVAELELLDNLTTDPPVGANPVKVTVQTEGVPPVSVDGLIATDATAGAMMPRVVDWETVPSVPVSFATCDAGTAEVVTLNVPVDLPTPMETELGTTAALELLDNLTVIPLGGAGPVSTTVPLDELPPVTDVGFVLIEASVGGFTVRFAD